MTFRPLAHCQELKVRVLAQAKKSHSTVLWDRRRWTGSIQRGKKSRNSQIPHTVNLEERGRDRSGGCRLLPAAPPSQLLVRPPHRMLEGNRAERHWQRRTVVLTLSTCSRFSSLPWSWFLSNRAKSLSCVTAPRVSLRLTYSDWSPEETEKRAKRLLLNRNMSFI